MNSQISFTPIAFVTNNRDEVSDDHWGDVVSEIILADHVPVESLYGMDQFSHLEIVFYMNKVTKVETGACHPRGNQSWPVTGIFAQRKKNRPNSIGLTIVELVSIEGKKITVKNLDAINNTPVLDIKPVFKEFLPIGKVSQPPWTSELMKNYW